MTGKREGRDNLDHTPCGEEGAGEAIEYQTCIPPLNNHIRFVVYTLYIYIVYSIY
jgi:hypothetical protein